MNIHVELKNIHVRFEDPNIMMQEGSEPFSIGFIMQSGLITPTNANFSKEAFIGPE